MAHYLVYDVETQPGGEALACIGVYASATARYRCWWPQTMDQEDWAKLRHMFSSSDCLMVSWNGHEHDDPRLARCGVAVGADQALDLYAVLRVEAGPGAGLRLEDVAQATLGEGKMSLRPGGVWSLYRLMEHGPRHLRRFARRKIARYCLQDVRLTMLIYEHLLTWGYVDSPLGRLSPSWVRSETIRG